MGVNMFDKENFDTVETRNDNTDLVEVISSQIDALKKFEAEILKSESSAQKAMDFVSNHMACYEEKGKWIFKHKSGNTKDIVEDTQSAITELANAQQVTVKALTVSFEFQKKLSKATKYLFNLGCASIAANRTVVRELECTLKNKGQEELSELARQELQNVIKELKAQEDIQKKQEDLNAKVKKNISRLNEKDYIDAVQTQRLEELSSLLDNKGSIDQKQEEAISGLKSELKEKSLLDNDQSKRIENNEKSIQIIHDFIKQKDILDKKQSAEIKQIKNGANLLSIIAIIISSVSLVCNIVIHFLK